MSTELGLNAPDPLDLLLHNTSQGDTSSDEASQNEYSGSEDWSKFSALWADGTDQSVSMKQYSDIMDFADLGSLPMDMDFNPSMAIEPSALHYDPIKLALPGLNYGYEDQLNAMSNDMISSGQFPFTFQSALSSSEFSGSSSASPQSFVKERRLSITSSSSSSGASLSPVPDSLPSPSLGYASVQPKDEGAPSPEPSSLYANDPAAELAHRVRQSAGVMLAVPIGAQFQGLNPSQQMAFPMSNTSQPKLPIPRLPRHGSTSVPKSSNASVSSSAASTPPPSTPPLNSSNPFKLTVNSNLPPSDSSNVSTPTSIVPTTAQPRPKTSHTTIERRYRTNLNARIQSLRMAVPALRVLEDREGGNGKKIKKNLKGGVIMKGNGIGIVDGEDGTIVDVIDERGFVDGVKVARKCSKANVLGKAVEYIRVLKKREQRLKAEQAGLKTLVSGLVGGPALVKEWEKEWRARFGGEEKDEVEGEDEDGDDDESEDEDGEDDDESGRKRKRPKVSAPKKADKEKKKPSSVPVVLLADGQQGNQAPEKRKRGRPRKILPPAVTLAPVAAISPAQSPDSIMQDDTSPTPASFSSTGQQPQWSQQPQQYLLAVFALFSFLNSPLTSSSSHHTHQHTGTVLNTLHPPLAYAPEIVSQFAAPTVAPIPSGWAWKEYVQLFHLLVSCLVLASFIFSWMGIGFGFGKQAIIARGRSLSARSPFRRRSGSDSRSAEQVDWSKLAQECVLDRTASSLSLFERLQIYRSISRKRNASINDLTTLAMTLWATTGPAKGFARRKARSVWAAAQAYTQRHTKHPIKISQRLVLESTEITSAAERLSSVPMGDWVDPELTYTPIDILGCLLVKERVKQHLGSLFVKAVSTQEELSEKDVDGEQEWRTTIEAAWEMGGHVEDLGKMLERVWKAKLGEDELIFDSESNSAMDGEIKALLTALVLYRRVFDADDGTSSSTLLSPPPSPGSKASAKRSQMLLSLRKALGNRVFEDAEEGQEAVDDVFGLEDARDRVVDMIVAAERRERGTSPQS